MKLIFKIAAGIIIGFLILNVLNVLWIKYSNDAYRNKFDDSREWADRVESYAILINVIKFHYSVHQKLPEYLSDLSCSSCASFQHDGIFYLSQNNNVWLSLKPYLESGKVQFQCKVKAEAQHHKDMFSSCTNLDFIPKPKKPSFDCNIVTTDIEKMICKSDRLIDSDLKLVAAYSETFKRVSDSIKEKIKSDQSVFIEKRRNECKSPSCIDNHTKLRILELKAY